MKHPKVVQTEKTHAGIPERDSHWVQMTILGLEKLSGREVWRRIYLDTKESVWPPIREKDLHLELVCFQKKMNGGVGRRGLLALRKKQQVEVAPHQPLVAQFQVLCVASQFGGIRPQAGQGVSSK